MTAPADSTQADAVRYLHDGQFLISCAEVLEGRKTVVPDVVIGYVRDADAKSHRVDLHNGGWACRCGTDGCAHVLCIRYATGHAKAPALGSDGKDTAARIRAAARKQRAAAASLRKTKGNERLEAAAQAHTLAAQQLDLIAEELSPTPIDREQAAS